MKHASFNTTRSVKAMVIATHTNTNVGAHMPEPIGIGMIAIDTFADAKNIAVTLIGMSEKIGTSTAGVIGRRLAIEGVTARIDTTIMEFIITSPLAITMTTTILAFAITGR